MKTTYDNVNCLVTIESSRFIAWVCCCESCANYQDGLWLCDKITAIEDEIKKLDTQ